MINPIKLKGIILITNFIYETNPNKLVIEYNKHHKYIPFVKDNKVIGLCKIFYVARFLNLPQAIAVEYVNLDLPCLSSLMYRIDIKR